jgi:hypothetical protein
VPAFPEKKKTFGFAFFGQNTVVVNDACLYSSNWWIGFQIIKLKYFS